jgi:hypothetical protein
MGISIEQLKPGLIELPLSSKEKHKLPRQIIPQAKLASTSSGPSVRLEPPIAADDLTTARKSVFPNF